MDIRNVLNGYFEKTPVPQELDPHNASSFVVPNLTQKKEATVEPQTEEELQEQARETVRIYSKEQTQNSVRISPQETKPRAVRDYSEEQTRIQKSGPAPKPEYSEDGEQEREVMDAAAFIKIVRCHKLTGREFLSILGNSKISNKAYQEIESNPGLTVKRLIELLEESPLTSADYERLAIAVQRMAELKAEAKAKIKSEPSRAAMRTERIQETKAQDTAGSGPKITPKTSDTKMPGYTPSAAKYYYDPDSDEDDGEEEEEEEEEKSKAEKEKVSSLKSRIQINWNDNYDDDDEDDEEQDSYGKKSGSNRGKIAVSAIGAVILIGISFGLRYHMTGSWLPTENAAVEEQPLNEAKIFDMLNTLPAGAPAFTANTLYSAGGLREESVFKSPICGNKRFLYTEKNKLYIYEQIGGQVAQLEVRDYKENTLAGIINAGGKLAAVSLGAAEPYSYAYTVPAEEEGEPDQTVTGTVQRNETYVEITDAFSPEKTEDANKITFSGSFVTAYLHEDRLIFVTYEELPRNSAGGDKATFMPYISVGGNKTFCNAEKVFVSSPTHKGFAAVFSVDINSPDNFDIATAAGGSRALVSKIGNELFIGQDSTLIRYDLTGGITENGSCEIPGRISDFSGINSEDGEIRVTTLEKSADSEEYAAALTVLDGELAPLGEIKNIGKGETLAATCFNKRETYIVTENGTCFGIDGENNGMSQSSVKITNETVYRYSDDIGVKITAADDGSKRTGLVVSTVRLDGNMTPLYSLEISSKTVVTDALDEYLSSPAEENINCLGGNGESGVLVIPVKYFDGVSQVERFVICRVGSDGILSVNGSVTEYDRRSENIFAQVDGDVVIAVTKGKIITAKSQDGSVLAYYLM